MQPIVIFTLSYKLMNKYLLILLLFLCGIAEAQDNVGIGASDPAVSALLELRASDKGLLVPRLTAAQRLAIANPANSLLVYDTDSACFFYYRSNVWKSLCSTALGTAGATGPQGLQGVTGANGATGPQGIQGATGAQGNAGAQGATGVTGANGANGATGPQGLQGPTGAAGANGATGPQGLQGATGVAGANGVTGPQGLQGPTGANGANGATGPQGVQGPTGAVGANGATGPQGVQGPTGANGANGVTGPQGVAGTAGAVGATGSTGVTGNTGATGPNWHITVFGIDSTGTVGLITDEPDTFIASRKPWLITGNAGTVGNVHFLGTTDDVPLNFRVNNQKAGRIEGVLPSPFSETATKGWENTSFGYQALNSNTPSFIMFQARKGFGNSAFGFRALASNTIGSNNIAIGHQAMLNNTIGNNNIAIGLASLSSNVSGIGNIAIRGLGNSTTSDYNVAMDGLSRYNDTGSGMNVSLGHSSMNDIEKGSRNTAVGAEALRGNSCISCLPPDVSYNVAMGYQAITLINSGNANVAIGPYSLGNFEAGDSNVAVGPVALGFLNNGYNNIGIGNSALDLLGLGNNNIGIGKRTQVPNNSGSNQVRIGDTQITYAGIQVPWTITSDRNWKSDIRNTELGLDFIGKLRPVQYYRTNDVKKRTEYGFIAQEVEETLKNFGVTNSGVITVGDDGMYGLRYNDIIAPLVRGMQELQTIIEEQNKKIENQQNIITKLIERLDVLENK